MGDIDADGSGVSGMATRCGQVLPGRTRTARCGGVIHRRPGELVVVGEPLFTLYTNVSFAAREPTLAGGWYPGQSAAVRPLIVDRTSDDRCADPADDQVSPKALLHDHRTAGRAATVLTLPGRGRITTTCRHRRRRAGKAGFAPSRTVRLADATWNCSHTVAVMQTRGLVMGRLRRARFGRRDFGGSCRGAVRAGAATAAGCRSDDVVDTVLIGRRRRAPPMVNSTLSAVCHRDAARRNVPGDSR